jgi:hypothetical protein
VIKEVRSPVCSGTKQERPLGVKHSGVYSDTGGSPSPRSPIPSSSRVPRPGELVDGAIQGGLK